MSKVNTDSNKIQELLTRGVENIYPTREFLEKELKSGRQLSLYTGYDPTAPTLHIGNGVTLMKLRQFQQLGHKVIMLIGDFTGLIGDPTDKGAARVQQTREQVLENCKEYQKQASAILDFSGDNPVELKFNSEWLGKLNFADVLELTSNFTVQRMLERDMFQKRQQDEKPIYLHEFLYPVMQAYDSVAMDVDGEVGGNDQTFNMLCGRDLMKSLKKKEKFVLTLKLLVDPTGKKMGKSEGNMVMFTDEPNDVFGKVMSWPDEMIPLGFEICTALSEEEIKTNMKLGPRDAKMSLAKDIVKTMFGITKANQAKKYFIGTFQRREVPDDVQEIKARVGELLSEVLARENIISSKSEFKRLIAGRGIAFESGEPVADLFQKIIKTTTFKVGKKKFVKIVLD